MADEPEQVMMLRLSRNAGQLSLPLLVQKAAQSRIRSRRLSR